MATVNDRLGGTPTEQYCRDLEAYLCRKNDGHLIRIVGPAFEQVCGWAARGVPFTVACRGIDRYFELGHRLAFLQKDRDHVHRGASRQAQGDHFHGTYAAIISSDTRAGIHLNGETGIC